MRWWMVCYANQMGVDNTSAMLMDFASLPSDVVMVEWRDGRGEIEREGLPGLRTNFIDVTPYAPFFQQFMQKLPGITLDQAKKIQTDLIEQLYDSKRQAPLPYTVAAGAYLWSATDAEVAAMASIMVPALYDMLAGTSADSLVGAINNRLAQLAANVNANFTTLVTNVNAQFVSAVVAIGNSLVDYINALVDYINDDVLGELTTGGNTINFQLQRDATPVAAPGLQGDIAHTTHTTVEFSSSTVGTGITDVSVPPISGGALVPSGGTIPWTPIGAAGTVDLALPEMIGIMDGISARRSTLVVTRNSKRADVGALTTLEAVIAYDVTTGW